jgi:hypothetical protein
VSQINGARFRAIYEGFLQYPSSPWNANPWELDLKVMAPLPIKGNWHGRRCVLDR